ncbi:glycoside hydrolase/phage tail family protein [Sulfitobacter sp. S0837]|uniref:baseplate multidomain protein megatron n=1 Tax=Sulfitobacter maritimus TaxID=2741719 RepID=UPI0015814B31|nr:glycoside hydrolase/phage tail family protein [Sulfitobacter maritimus]NUH64571.1 glycoside hydrolase/phage tail family protein [Sulfitobacter maritimus]
MATIVLSAAGAALGGSIGGTLAGLSSVAVGRAVGATLGRLVDQRLLGQGGQAVETGRVDRFRLTGSGEGEAITQLYGRMRLSGHVIWASQFKEDVSVSGGGKGGPPKPKTTSYSYTVSLAIALCEGEITSVGRVWADGVEVAPDDLNMRVYTGSRDQQPDPTIAAIEGRDQVPAYRGTAYVVFEDLPLAQFGNRVPQFSFEVMRPEQTSTPGWQHVPPFGVKGVALIPGTGEYSLATTPVHYSNGPGANWSANINTPAGKTDFSVSLESLTEELPKLEAASLVVCWFGSDLRCGECRLRPKVEDAEIEGENMPWAVSGLSRSAAEVIATSNDRPIYGGTPADAAVVEAIQALRQAGKAVMFYPFILMDQTEGNDLPDPYSDALSQPALPWRGRITLSKAPGRPGSPDGSAVAEDEVAAFFGTVTAADFTISGETVSYSGPEEWSLSRFILHYAALCAAAGGVDAFCISSEMRGITQVRGVGNAFVAVAALRQLAAEVRALLGPSVKISYAADWSEYFGYHPQDGSGDLFFHLDPLWADDNIDFIGIDNYMPLADWRDGDEHLDAAEWSSIHEVDYLKANIEGGEGYDWYYHSPEARAAQIRTPITDGAHGEPWVYRYKDLRNWWRNSHHNRINGIRDAEPTDWVPMSKPIWFTEYGCAAIDKGANQPNKFLDLKSSESALPRYSNGARDDLMQIQYLRAMSEYWSDPAHNPMSEEYGGRMLDLLRAFVWAWDMRPFPYFPNNVGLWSDGENYPRGHWLNGRASGRTLASVVGEICRRAGVEHFDTSQLFGYVRGYAVDHVGEGRQALQPLMLRYGFDAIERAGVLTFQMRDGADAMPLDPAELAVSPDLAGITEQLREAEAEIAGRVRLRFVEADGDFDVVSEEAVLADEATHAASGSELNMALTRGEGRQLVERWLTESRVARETVRLALPPSRMALGAGDVIELPGDGQEGSARYRIDRVEKAGALLVEGVRIEPEVYDTLPFDAQLASLRPFVPPVPVLPHFMDLPLMRGDEVPYAPHLAVTANPWPGSVAVYRSASDSDYALNGILPARATIGTTGTPLLKAPSGLLEHGPVLEVKLTSGTLQSVSREALLNGANLAAIGDGSADNWELFQFEQAELVAPLTYWLSGRLRGQAGTDALMPDAWPAESVFVLMDGHPQQLELGRHQRRVAQHYRIGPAQRPVGDPSYLHRQHAFDGNGLRPYSPCHLRSETGANGDVHISWVRRTRVDGDPWEGPDVPLGEEQESYLVRVAVGSEQRREVLLNAPNWSYSKAEQTADGVAAPFSIEVAQVSAAYGAGLAARLQVVP